MNANVLNRAKLLDAQIKDAEEWEALLDAMLASPMNLVPLATERGQMLWPLMRDYPGAMVAAPIMCAAVRVKLAALRAELEGL
jgi:hypothetical protein